MTRQDWTLSLGLAGIVVAIVGGSCSTNARIDALAAHVDARIDSVTTQIGELRADLRRLDDRLRVVEVILGRLDQRLGRLERLDEPRSGTAPGERRNSAKSDANEPITAWRDATRCRGAGGHGSAGQRRVGFGLGAPVNCRLHG